MFWLELSCELTTPQALRHAINVRPGGVNDKLSGDGVVGVTVLRPTFFEKWAPACACACLCVARPPAPRAPAPACKPCPPLVRRYKNIRFHYKCDKTVWKVAEGGTHVVVERAWDQDDYKAAEAGKEAAKAAAAAQ